MKKFLLILSVTVVVAATFISCTKDYGGDGGAPKRMYKPATKTTVQFGIAQMLPKTPKMPKPPTNF